MRLSRIVMAGAVLCVIAAGCAQEGGGRPSKLDVTAVDFGFQGVASEIRGGVVDLTFTNEGEASHEFALIDAGGVAATRFKESFGPVLEGGPFPKFWEAGQVLFEAAPGETRSASFTLPEGEYFLFCALTDEKGGSGDDQPEGDPHFDLGMIQEVSVDTGNERELEADGGAFVAKDYTFEIPGDIEVGERAFEFRNDGPEQWHHMVLQRFPAGTSEEDALDAFRVFGELEEGEAPPEDTPMPEEAGGTGIASPGLAQTMTLDLEPGTYLAVCFIQDIQGGPPHAFAHNMMKTFTVDG